ncbi:MAG: phosphate ABC transporter permease subunit PstC [Chromatiales bacterium]|nr:phosphate ABC transporter permease subunit PstC [Chromatiales bacterium]
MSNIQLIILLLSASTLIYIIAGRRAKAIQMQNHVECFAKSAPIYYAWHTALWSSIPPLIILLGWFLWGSYLPASIKQAIDASPFPVLMITCTAVLLIGAAWGWQCIDSQHNTRKAVEKLMTWVLISASIIAILTTIGIVVSVLFESIKFFNLVPISEFFSLHWSPQTAIRDDQVGASGAFGAIPLFAGTLLITIIAMTLALPVGLMSAIFLAEYATSRVRNSVKPLLEILAGIPTVVYGFIAVLWLAPSIKSTAEALGLQASAESALAAGLAMGVMLIPFICSFTDDALHAVPKALRDSSYALGATHSETINKVVLPAAIPGIMGGILLAVSRAIGETMIVVMAAGMSAKLTGNPLDSTTTVTVQIVALLIGDHEFDSAKTLAAFALGLTLFLATLMLNVVALKILKTYREQYE